MVDIDDLDYNHRQEIKQKNAENTQVVADMTAKEAELRGIIEKLERAVERKDEELEESAQLIQDAEEDRDAMKQQLHDPNWIKMKDIKGIQLKLESLEKQVTQFPRTDKTGKPGAANAQS